MKTILLLLCAGGCTLGTLARTVRVSDFGFDPVDSTRFVQAALDSGAETVVLDHRPSPWYVTPLLVRSDTEFVVEPATELVAKRGEFRKIRDYLFTLDGVSNVVVRGGAGSTFRMWKCDYQKPPYEKSEWRYALRIVRSRNVRVENMRFVESGGDGIVIGGNSKGVTIRNCVCDRNHRQGISLCSGEDVLIEDTVLSNTEGTAPQAGIDIEPDLPQQRLVNCTLRNVLSYGNAGAGFDMYLNNLDDTSSPVSIRLENCRAIGNVLSLSIPTGAAKETNRYVRGSIVMERCRFENPQRAAISIGTKPETAYSVTFRDCVVSNGVSGKPAVVLGGGSANLMTFDGLRFDNLSVFQPGPAPWLQCGHSLNLSRPRAISGDVRVTDASGRTERIVLDDAWVSRRMKVLPLAAPLAARGTLASLATATVIDSRPGCLVDLPDLTLVGAGGLVFSISAPGEAVFVGRQVIKVKGRPASKNEYTVQRITPDGRLVALKKVKPFGTTATERAIACDRAGFYRLEIPQGGTRFKLERANVPVAIDCSKGMRTIGQEGDKPVDLWFLESSGGTDFISMGTDYYRFVPTFFTADGTLLEGISVDGFGTACRHGQCSGELSRVRFASAREPHYDWIMFDLRSASPFVFLSPDRHWR